MIGGHTREENAQFSGSDAADTKHICFDKLERQYRAQFVLETNFCGALSGAYGLRPN